MTAALTRAFIYEKLTDKRDARDGCKQIAGALGVTSAQDMIQQLKQIQPEGKKFNVIAISGHGAESWQGIGSGRSTQYTKGSDFKAGRLKDVAQTIQNLNLLMHSNSILFLAGCSVGCNDHLICELSELMQNVYVCACDHEVMALVGDDSVEMHRARNGRDSGKLDVHGLVVARNGKRVNMTADIEVNSEEDSEDDAVHQFIQSLAIWPYIP